MQDEFGYDPSRFDSPMLEQFICPICTQVAKNPKECKVCGSLFCLVCVTSWLKKKSECPRAKCDLIKNPLQEISGALRRIYNSLDVHCQYENCGKKALKLCDLEKHEETCAMPKCKNFDVCEKNVSQNFKDQAVCDLSCLLLLKIRQQNSNWGNCLKEIKEFLQKYGQGVVDNINYGNINQNQQQNFVQQPSSQQNLVGGQLTSFKWDKQACGTGIEISNNNCTVFLKESAYMFRTVLGDTPMYGGIHYWEIVADVRTENELKIGLATKKDFNYNSAFCDYEFGYAYYGLGQLRQNSNAAGPQYGKKFKKEGTLGLCLDMNKGSLSLALDGDYWGPAFQSPALKKGPIYAAVSLLHCAGCRLNTGKPVPQYFLQ